MEAGGGREERLGISIDLAAGRQIKLLSAGSSCCSELLVCTGALCYPERPRAGPGQAGPGPALVLRAL